MLACLSLSAEKPTIAAKDDAAAFRNAARSTITMMAIEMRTIDTMILSLVLSRHARVGYCSRSY